MTQRRNSDDSVLFKTLAGLAALGGLACLLAAAMMALGTLAASAVRVLGAALGAGTLLWTCLRLLRVAQQADPDRLDPASELTTLTFPPHSRLDRPRLHRGSSPQ
jgi:hypothetical protein